MVVKPSRDKCEQVLQHLPRKKSGANLGYANRHLKRVAASAKQDHLQPIVVNHTNKNIQLSWRIATYNNTSSKLRLFRVPTHVDWHSLRT